jgi:hypothetical protein
MYHSGKNSTKIKKREIALQLLHCVNTSPNLLFWNERDITTAVLLLGNRLMYKAITMLRNRA